MTTPEIPPDGLGGTDGAGREPIPEPGNVLPLFKDRLTAAGLPVSPEVVAILTGLLEDAKSGRITSVGLVAFSPTGDFLSGTWGAGPYTGMVGGLEDLKFKIINSHLIHTMGLPK